MLVRIIDYNLNSYLVAARPLDLTTIGPSFFQYI